MTTRVIGWISGVLRTPGERSAVHFHRGPGATPAVCHDERCDMPRLDV